MALPRDEMPDITRNKSRTRPVQVDHRSRHGSIILTALQCSSSPRSLDGLRRQNHGIPYVDPPSSCLTPVCQGGGRGFPWRDTGNGEPALGETASLGRRSHGDSLSLRIIGGKSSAIAMCPYTRCLGADGLSRRLLRAFISSLPRLTQAQAAFSGRAAR